MNSLYVIIVTWNGMKWIKRCLDALQESTYPVRTVVIDNGSNDETVIFIRHNYPEIHIIESGKNLGFGQANNVGMQYALTNGCDYVFLLNQDAYVYPNMFDELLKVAEKSENNKYAILSPLHIHRDKTALDTQFRKYITDATPIMFQDNFLDSLKPVYSTKGTPAAGWLLPRKTLETIGGFDPIFFHYGEDDHYMQRVHYHGYEIGLVPSAKMIHDRENFGNEEIAKKDMLFRNMKTYILLNINLSNSYRWRKIILIHLGLLLNCIRNKNFKEVFSSMWRAVKNELRYSKDRTQNKVIGPNWL